MSVDAMELVVVIISGVLIVGVVYELAKRTLQWLEDHYHDGTTKR